MPNLSIVMSIRSRNELKYLFQNSTQLSQGQFAELIDSLLNKRDDQFHGKWKEGQAYRVGDVVIHNNALWTWSGATDPANPDQIQAEICASLDNQPSDTTPGWDSLIIPSHDDDWRVIEDENVMWALVHDKVGIGIGNEMTDERPESKLDVREEGRGRMMIFPSDNTHSQFNLVNYDASAEKSYLVTGLSLEEVCWLTDADKGYVFKSGIPLVDTDKETDPECSEGQVMMVIKPKKIQGGNELATLGLNTEDPGAMLDVTDNERGQLLFTPDEKCDPALSIVNLDPECDQNYIAHGVGKYVAAFVSDAPDGFVFLKGGEYGEFCNEQDINQGELLVSIQENSDTGKAHVGIGTGEPEAILEIRDEEASSIVLLPPEAQKSTGTGGTGNTISSGASISAPADTPANTGPNNPGPAESVISIQKLQPPNAKTYFTSGLEDDHAGWTTNAQNGFVFRQGGPFGADDNEICLNQGEVHVVIREDGKVGIGTETPYTKVEIANKQGTDQVPSGKFLFNLDQKVNPALGILNLRPGATENYFTIGADNNHAILVTDSQYGFVFKKGTPIGTNDSEIDVNQGAPLVSIRPEGKGKVGIGKLPLEYQLNVDGMTMAFTFYQDTDESKITKERDLENVLENIQNLNPIVFKWNTDTGYEAEGEQFGFFSHEVSDVFSQVVKTSMDGTMAVAYQNLIPVLVAGMKELTAEKDNCQNELDQLRLEFETYKETVNATLADLDERLKECEK